MGGVGILIAIIFIVIRYTMNRQPAGISGDSIPKSWIAAIPAWLLLMYGWALLGAGFGPIGLIYCACASVVAFPSFYSLIAAKVGWVKASFFLGRMSVLFFLRSPSAGGLWRGLQATRRQPTDDARRDALAWLKERFCQQTGDIHSGEIVLYVVIEAFLDRPGDADHMAEQLHLLDGIGTASIPGPVRRYVTMLLLAPALARRDHAEILSAAEKWDTLYTNPIASYLVELYSHFNEKPWASRWRLRFWQWRVRRHPSLIALGKNAPEASTSKLSAPLTRSDAINAVVSNSINPHDHQDLRDRLLAGEQQSLWKKRAENLGVWDIDRGWNAIIDSVDSILMPEAADRAARFDPDVERHYATMRYLCRSIANRLAQGRHRHAVQDFLEWFTLRKTMYALRHDEAVLNAAFSANYTVIWNWVVELWNTRKYRCLAHYIANVCEPVARKSGHRDLSELLGGLAVGHYR